MTNSSTHVTAVLLLNLGGPEHLDDVEPFLYNLFSDRQIIRLGPPFMQKFIARRIARKRAPTSRANYAKIGGGSPILAITRRQAQALETSLAQDGNYLVRPCMRYWSPFAHEILTELKTKNIHKIIALPLYPHYSVATTASSLADLERELQKMSRPPRLEVIRSWPDQPHYIDCLAKRITDRIEEMGREGTAVVYSAHSLPREFIDKGDPYVQELHRTITALEQKTGIQGQLCYQSRSGPVQWLEPSTPDMLHTLAGKGMQKILMVPLSFVSDHIETLYEIDMLYRDMAGELGMELQSTPGLNDDPLFIEGLRQLVLAGGLKENQKKNSAG